LDIAVSRRHSGAQALAKTVRRLTSLQILRLDPGDCSAEILPALQDLPCLVQLELGGTYGCGSVRLRLSFWLFRGWTPSAMQGCYTAKWLLFTERMRSVWAVWQLPLHAYHLQQH
jgi:hypothetical protein